jgi:hypothetical protein
VYFSDPSGLVGEVRKSGAEKAQDRIDKAQEKGNQVSNVSTLTPGVAVNASTAPGQLKGVAVGGSGAKKGAGGQANSISNEQGSGKSGGSLVAFYSDIKAPPIASSRDGSNRVPTETLPEVNKETFNEGTGWDAIIFDNPGDMAAKVAAYYKNNGPIKNLVIIAHGSTGTLVGFVLSEGTTLDGSVFLSPKSQKPFAKALALVANLMADDGNLVFGACGCGRGNFYGYVARYLARNLADQSKSINLFFNLDNTTISFQRLPMSKGAMIAEYVYDIPFGKPSQKAGGMGWIQTTIINGSFVPGQPLNNLLLNRGGKLTPILK